MSILSAPKFLTMPAVGLDISSDSVRFIELEPYRGHFKVARFGEATLLSGIVQGGTIHDPIALSKVVGELAHEHHLTMANIALPEEQAFLAHMEFPRVPLRDVGTAVEVHLEEYVPVPPSEVIYDYVITDSDDEDMTSVIASVLPQKIVDQYLEIFRDTSIIPKSFEFQSHAMARALFTKNDRGAYMGIDIGKDITNVFIVRDGIVYFSAILDIGGDTLTNAIVRKLGMPFAEAENMKARHGLVGGAEGGALRDAMLPVLEDLRSRILRHFAFWQSRNATVAAIERVLLTGGGANLKGMTEYLGQGVRVPMLVANPWINVCDFTEYVPDIPLHAAHGYTAAIGLALRNDPL